MKTTMGVKLDDKIRGRLKAMGEQKERSPHWLMRRAIEEYLDREEAFEHEKQEDMQRWQQYMDTGEYISHDKMKDKLMGFAMKARRQNKSTG